MRRATAIVLLLVVACGQAQRAGLQYAADGVRVAHSALNATRDEFVKWERAYLVTVASTLSPEEAEAAVAAFRARRPRIHRAFAAAYLALGEAAGLLIDASKADVTDLPGVLKRLYAAQRELARVLDEVRR